MQAYNIVINGTITNRFRITQLLEIKKACKRIDASIHHWQRLANSWRAKRKDGTIVLTIKKASR